LSLLEEEHGGYVCHPRAPSGNNSRTNSFITPTTRKTEVLESPLSNSSGRRGKWTLLESLLVVAACQVVERYVQFTLALCGYLDPSVKSDGSESR
jgi:hypothetical protein